MPFGKAVLHLIEISEAIFYMAGEPAIQLEKEKKL